MIKLSSKVRYALLALLELASHYERGNCLQIDQIVASQPIPEGYLVQVLIALRRCGLVSSQRGTRGGYSLNKTPSEITLFEIVACLEGKRQLWGQETSPHPENLLIEQIWQEAENSVITVFDSYTLKDICDKREKCRQSDAMYYI